MHLYLHDLDGALVSIKVTRVEPIWTWIDFGWLTLAALGGVSQVHRRRLAHFLNRLKEQQARMREAEREAEDAARADAQVRAHPSNPRPPSSPFPGCC